MMAPRPGYSVNPDPCMTSGRLILRYNSELDYCECESRLEISVA